MRLLQFGIGMGNQRTGFAQSKASLPEQALALADLQTNLEALLKPSAQGLPIPQRARQTEVARGPAQGPVDLQELRFAQTSEGVPNAGPRSVPRNPWLQNAAPNTRRCGGRRPASALLPGRLLPGPPTGHHGDGDHSAILPNGESRLAVRKSWFGHHRFVVVSCVNETTNSYNAQLLMTLRLELFVRRKRFRK